MVHTLLVILLYALVHSNLSGMEKDNIASDQGAVSSIDQEPHLQEFIQAEITRQLHEREEQRPNRNLGAIRRFTSGALSYAEQYPVATTLTAIAIVAIPLGVYWLTRPVFTSDNKTYQGFYHKILTNNQRSTYGSRLLQVKNPLELVDYRDFMQSLTQDQNLELLLLFRNFIEECKHRVPEEEYQNQHADFVQLCIARCKGFEKIVLRKLALEHQSPELLESYNEFYRASGIQCTSTLIFPEDLPLLGIGEHRCIGPLDRTKIALWDSSTGICRAVQLLPFKQEISLLSLSPTGSLIAASSRGGDICILSSNELIPLLSWTLKNVGLPMVLGWNTQGSRFVLGTDKGILIFYDSATGKQLESIRNAPMQLITKLHILADDSLFILAQGHASLKPARMHQFNSQETPPLNGAPHESDTVISYAELVDEAYVGPHEWAALKNKSLLLYDYYAPQNKKIIPLPHSPAGLAGSPDGRFYAIATKGGTIIIVDKTGRIEGSFQGLSENIQLTCTGDNAIIGLCRGPTGSFIRTWEKRNSWQALFKKLCVIVDQDPDTLLPAETGDPYVLLAQTNFISAVKKVQALNLLLSTLEMFSQETFEQRIDHILGDDPKGYKAVIETRNIPEWVLRAGILTQEQKDELNTLNTVMEIQMEQLRALSDHN